MMLLLLPSLQLRVIAFISFSLEKNDIGEQTNKYIRSVVVVVEVHSTLTNDSEKKKR